MTSANKNNSIHHSPVENKSDTVKVANINPVADAAELEKGKPMITVEIIEYASKSVGIQTILKKSSGTVSVMSVDSGKGLSERTTPFDTFVQVIDGKVELVIDGKNHLLKTGASIIIPAHAAYHVKPDGRFKMILTIIKSAYE